MYDVGVAGMTLSGVSGVLGLGCWIAGRVCTSQAQKSSKSGDPTKSEKLIKAVKGLDIATATCLGISGVTGIGGRILYEKG